MEENNQVEILLIEDSPKDIELTLYTLRQNNLANHIKVTRDGEEALDFLLGKNQYADRDVEEQPRVILLDLKLPKIDGLEVLKTIKKNPLTHRIPVVVLTSSREEKDLIESYELGANSYLVKPIDFDQFTGSIKEIGLYWLLQNVVSRR